MNAIRALLCSLAVAALAPGAGAQAETAAALQKTFAGGTDAQKRLRVDDLAVADGKAKLTGAFLDAPAPKEGAPTAFATAQEEVTKLVRAALKNDNLVLDWSGVTKVEEKDQPHVVLQRAANAAGAKGETSADRVLFASSRFGPDGALVLAGTRGKDPAVAKWVAGAGAEHLAKNPAVRVVSDEPLVTDELKPVEWKLTAADVQKLFSASTDPATRRLRADRVYLTHDADNFAALRLTLAGARLGEDAVDTEVIPDALRMHWPDLFTGPPRVLIDLKPLLGPGVPDLAPKLQAAIAAKPALDGVRVDVGAEFGADGSLMLAGVQPGLSPAGEKELDAVYRAVLKQFVDKGDAASARYERIGRSALSTKNMRPVATAKVLGELREWAATTTDDARVSRVYFAADGALKLEARTVAAGEAEQVQKKFKGLVAKHLAAELPGGGDTMRPPPAADVKTFGASLTAHLRKEMAADQKKWSGVLIERGFFDAANRYTLRGVVDNAKQNDDLAKLVEALKSDPKLAEFYQDAPNKPVLDVVPLGDLLDRVKRVAPAYPEFDRVRIESARYDADVNLVFDAITVGPKVDDAAAALLAKLIRDHKDFRRRAPADKQVKIVRTGGPPNVDGEGDAFSVAAGAKLLAGGDEKKIRAWLDGALLRYPNESGVWFLSAYHHHTKGDAELVRRDLFRVIGLEGPVGLTAAGQRKRRYENTNTLQGKERNELDALVTECLRAIADGAKPITLTKDK